MKASREKAVTAVLCGKREVLHEPSVFCFRDNHSSALAVACLVASSILTSAARTRHAGATKRTAVMPATMHFFTLASSECPRLAFVRRVRFCGRFAPGEVDVVLLNHGRVLRRQLAGQGLPDHLALARRQA